MTIDTTYNGWTNYETWNVNLWIENEEGSHRYWRDVAQETYNEARDTPSAYSKMTDEEIFTQEERAALTLADRLKEEHEENAPELGASMWADLLNAALSEVNWHEIASSMIDDCDKTEPTDDEEE